MVCAGTQENLVYGDRSLSNFSSSRGFFVFIMEFFSFYYYLGFGFDTSTNTRLLCIATTYFFGGVHDEEDYIR